MTSAAVVAPVVERLISIEGTLSAPVHHLQFRGLTFEHTTWLVPNHEGYVGDQASVVFTQPSASLKTCSSTAAALAADRSMRSPARSRRCSTSGERPTSRRCCSTSGPDSRDRAQLLRLGKTQSSDESREPFVNGTHKALSIFRTTERRRRPLTNSTAARRGPWKPRARQCCGQPCASCYMGSMRTLPRPRRVGAVPQGLAKDHHSGRAAVTADETS
jgi:hypothetical protein